MTLPIITRPALDAAFQAEVEHLEAAGQTLRARIVKWAAAFPVDLTDELRAESAENGTPLSKEDEDYWLFGELEELRDWIKDGTWRDDESLPGEFRLPGRTGDYLPVMEDLEDLWDDVQEFVEDLLREV